MVAKLLSFLFLGFCWSGLLAQSTITEATLPAIGDTLMTVFDGVPTEVRLTPPGPNQTWKYTKLRGFKRITVFYPPPGKTLQTPFPEANLLGIDNLGGIRYFQKSPSKLAFVGQNGPDPLGLQVNTIARVKPAFVERQVPLKYKDRNVQSAEITMAFAAEDLPAYITDSLPITPDSVRFRMDLKITSEVDAWGVLSIPGGDYEVLREKRQMIRKTKVDTKISPLPWLDITDLVAGALPMVGLDTVLEYHFYSEEEIQPIAILNVNAQNKKVNSVEYKANNVINNINYIDRGKTDVFAYPNPAIEEVRFEFLNLPAEQYTLTIYNILGKEEWKKSYKINSNQTVRVDLSEFRKGTYLYSVTSEKGKTITTKRLVILRP